MIWWHSNLQEYSDFHLTQIYLQISPPKAVEGPKSQCYVTLEEVSTVISKKLRFKEIPIHFESELAMSQQATLTVSNQYQIYKFEQK